MDKTIQCTIKMTKIMTIVGARPQFIKSAPVSRALQHAGIGQILVHTGQHYDQNMSEIFFEELGLPRPDINLGVGSGSHAKQTATMLVGVEAAILKNRPELVLVYGDTNSTLAGALAAAKLGVPVAHVESGLRSFNVRMPEEINRILTDRLAKVLFTPSRAANENLRREGFPEECIRCVGDVMYDAILMFRDLASMASGVMERLDLVPKNYVLATVHRAENTESRDRLQAIFEGLSRVGESLKVVLPLHPRTKNAYTRIVGRLPDNLLIIEPLGFIDMQRLETDALVIATDSGGVQKEAYWHGVPCVTLRDETEWMELVETGANLLCPPKRPVDVSDAILSRRTHRIGVQSLYGDGTAAKQIAASIGTLMVS